MKLAIKNKILIILFSIITLVGLFFISRGMFEKFIIPFQFIVAAISLIFFQKMKDGLFKFYMVLHFILLAASSYVCLIRDEWHAWFGTFIAITIVSYIPLLMAGLRRNAHLHALSLMRQHPWISAVLMGVGYFAYKEIGVLKGPREIPIVLLLAVAVITILFLFERSQKVTRGSFYYMLIGAMAVFAFHFIILKSTIGRIEDWMPMTAIILSGISSCLLVIGSLLYEAPE